MWNSVSITTDEALARTLADKLMELGALSVSIEDADAGTDDEQPQYGEPGEGEPALWQHSTVSALFDPSVNYQTVTTQAFVECAIEPPLPITVQEIAEENWVQLTQSQFAPIRISSRLWIVPSWHNAPEPDAINIILDPGMAFGTGSHPTTRLCLEWLDSQIKGGERLLDYGCGSGILAIAAKKLGAGQCTGIDIDAAAIVAALANSNTNKTNIHWQHLANALNEQYDIIVANILTNPLCVLAPAICSRLTSDGRLALSGVLAEQAERVITAYAPYIELRVGAEEESWIRLEGRKK